MSKAIHIITARTMLNSGDPVDISVWKANGSILELRNCISLRYNFYGGWRNVKLLSSGKSAKSEIVAYSPLTTAKYSCDNGLYLRNNA